MTLVEISEREVIEAARRIKEIVSLTDLNAAFSVDVFDDLYKAVTLLEERERVAGNLDQQARETT